MTSIRRAIPLSLLAAWAAVVALLTLAPSGYTQPLTVRTFFCVACTVTGTADIIVNWMMFLPGGALMAVILDKRRAVILALCFTVIIETFQIGISGRNPGIQDVVFNTLGAWSGALFVQRRLGSGGRHVVSILAAAAWLSPAVLLIPLAPRSDLYGLWTPALASVEKYEGRVISTLVGEIPVPSGIVARKSALDTAIMERGTIEVVFEVGQEPSEFAPVFQIASGERVAGLTMGVVGKDLIVRGHAVSGAVRLNRPAIRWSGGMRAATRGDTVRVVVDRSRNSVCMSVNLRTECGLAPSLGDGWAHLLNLQGAPGWIRALLSILWSVGLGGLIGTTSTTAREALVTGFGLGLAGLIVGGLSPDVRPDVLHAALLAMGSLLGACVSSPISRLWRTVRSL